jgi:hypothetical protein
VESGGLGRSPVQGSPSALQGHLLILQVTVFVFLLQEAPGSAYLLYCAPGPPKAPSNSTIGELPVSL